MEHCDVLIVGGGPAGASCARSLVEARLDVVVLDRAVFPRDKVCAGWVTPSVLQQLGIDPEEYRRGHTLQPFTGFLVGTVGGRTVETRYDGVVSYGILRREFDDYLLRRTGARLRLGESLSEIDRGNGGWIANGSLAAPVLVGAGGHFCPTRRFLEGARRDEVVVAQEAEVELTPAEARACPVAPDTPELYFCPDLQGYGWCLRKGNFLNVGLGRTGDRSLREHAASFVDFLRGAGRVPAALPLPLKGHAYALRAGPVAPAAGEKILWVGDAAGLADPKSGEGIGPAVESGLAAARRILEADGDYRSERLSGKDGLRRHRPSPAFPLPSGLRSLLARRLLETRWFTRNVVLDRWFLRSSGPPPAPPPKP